ncbi:hypothetical protein GF359_05080 [candidate division WOR-3 bacterium]|uniref:Uncharacterized protein n=1 Tax=candidate division WOR-3 bacterium TaxID=2052148 RepID=A0A9D5K9E6_UNCW3|nr:hypothetical protein [candidate division WOR-3 bacterium]MBD3364569.1 hypothetical protein [candidate division WOR-3 bacterium]
MGRFKYNFNVLLNRKAFRDLKKASPLRKLLATIRDELSERSGSTFEFVSDGLNPYYDARFITHASGDVLDKWGETLDLPRNPGESDEDYRTRLLDELRDFTACLTVKSITDRVEDTMGPDKVADITPVWSLATRWPLDWWEDTGSENVTWCNWVNLLDFLLVLTDAPSDPQLAEIISDLEAIRFATTRAYVVTDSGSGYYNLHKLID